MAASLRVRLLGGVAALAAVVLLSSAPSMALVWPNEAERIERQLLEGQLSERRDAAAQLVRLPEVVATRVLPKVLADSDDEVRLLGARAVLHFRLRGLGKQVISWLNDADQRIRRAAAELLAFSPEPTAVTALARLLGDPESEVRLKAAEALGNARQPEATLALLGRLDDPNPEVREAVVLALETLRDKRAVVPLLGKIQDPRPSIRRGAARALGLLGDRRAVSALMLALRDNDAGVRVDALRALGELKASDSLLSVAALAEEDNNLLVRGTAVRTLAAIGSEQAQNLAIRFLASRHADVRTAAERALAEMGERVVDKLAECARTKPLNHASSCVVALGRLQHPNATAAIMQVLEERRVPVHISLAALARQGDPTALPNVLELLGASDPHVRHAAIRAAYAALDPENPDGRVVEPIEQAITGAHTDPEELEALLRLLGRSGAPRAGATLERYARSSGPREVRLAAVEALGEVGPHAFGDVLLAALDSDDFELRWLAAQSLRRAGSPKLVGPLLEGWATAPLRRRLEYGVALAGPLANGATAAQVKQVTAWLDRSGGAELDVLLESLAYADSASTVSEFARVADRATSDATRAKVAESVTLLSKADELLVQLAADESPRVRASAVWSIGARVREGLLSRGRETRAFGVVRDAVQNDQLMVAANAVAALGRIAAAVPTLREASLASLCRALADARHFVRANALGSLRLLVEKGVALPQEQSCNTETMVDSLRYDVNRVVRRSAAELLHRVENTDARVRWTLRQCASDEADGSVALACGQGASAVPSGSVSTTVYVFEPGGVQRKPQSRFALRFADGLIRLGISDRRGAVFEAVAAKGRLQLEVPW